MLDEEQDYTGYKVALESQGIKVFEKKDESNPNVPFLRLEMDIPDVYPDQIYKLYDDEHILEQ